MHELQGSVLILLWLLFPGQQQQLTPNSPPVSIQDSATKARQYFIMGETTEGGESLAYYSKGRFYAAQLVSIKPDGVEGHYWIALNLAGIAEASARQALNLLPTILGHLESARSIDQAYDQAGPLRVLGRIYCKAPPWPISEGDLDKSLLYLSTAVSIAPWNSTNHLYLAKTFIELDRIDEALFELEQTLSSTQAVTPRNLEEDQTEARDLIQELRPKGRVRQ